MWGCFSFSPPFFLSDQPKVSQRIQRVGNIDRKPGVYWVTRAETFHFRHKFPGTAQDSESQARQCPGPGGNPAGVMQAHPPPCMLSLSGHGGCVRQSVRASGLHHLCAWPLGVSDHTTTWVERLSQTSLGKFPCFLGSRRGQSLGSPVRHKLLKLPGYHTAVSQRNVTLTWMCTGPSVKSQTRRFLRFLSFGEKQCSP